MNKGKNGGITLIALIITIIVMLILAGIVITTLAGDKGLITTTKESKFKTEVSQIKEVINLEQIEYSNVEIIKQIKLGDIEDKIAEGYFKDEEKLIIQTGINQNKLGYYRESTFSELEKKWLRDLGIYEINREEQELLTALIKYDITNPTNKNVIATLIASEEVENISGWINSGDNKTFRKEYVEDKTEIISIKTNSGKTADVEVDITWIDKIAPTITGNRSIADNIIIYDSSYDINIVNVFATDSKSGIKTLKYVVANTEYETGNFPINDAQDVPTNGEINNIQEGKIYTIYAEDNAGNSSVKAIKTLKGPSSNPEVDIKPNENIQINVGSRQGNLITGYYRMMNINTYNGYYITYLGEHPDTTHYYSIDFTEIESARDKTSFTKAIYRDGKDKHAFLLKISNGSNTEEYLIWMKIENELF